jgi:2-dehydro-3-deoxyphosphogalactonate aldolase
MSTVNAVASILQEAPLIAILRGVQPDEVLAVADVLLAAGFRGIEVPLNSPQPFLSIERLARHVGAGVAVGAGTVLTVAQADAAADAGAGLILAPNCNPAVIHGAVQRGLYSMPGVATPTEAFAALDAGAHAIKLFPADVLGTASVKAWKAVLPAGTGMFVVGGIGADNLASFRAAGAQGAGLGSSLYVPGLPLDELRVRASRLLAAWAPEGATV